jgi:hypothetical protein
MSKKLQKTRKGLTRRELIRSGLVAGSVAFLTAKSGRTLAQTGSPPVVPFVDELPIPPIAEPVPSLNPEPHPAGHQRYAEFQPQKF